MRFLAVIGIFVASVVYAQLDPNLVPECNVQCHIQAAAAVGCTNGWLDSQNMAGCDIMAALNDMDLQCKVPVDQSILCNAPYAWCNGICMDPRLQPCSSAGVTRRDIPRCLPGEAVCRLDRFVGQGRGRSDSGAYECIDIHNNAEACGGCPGDGGIDCTNLYGVSDVECKKGRCIVSACNNGLSLIDGRCK